MAGDWIPITTDLVRRREVALIAQQLKRSPQEVAGFLLEFWGWASGETEDGVIRGYSVATACATLGHPAAFYDMLLSENVGWLRKENGSLVIVNWDRWLSNSAKARLGKSLGQRLRRSKKGGSVATSVATKLLPEERRVEYSTLPPPPPTPASTNGQGGGDGGGLEIDWGKAKATANTIIRAIGVPAPKEGKYRRLILQAAALVPRIGQDWLDDAVEDTRLARPNKPWQYWAACLRSGTEARGVNLDALLAHLPVPAEYLTKEKP